MKQGNRIYITVTIVAIILALVLILNYGLRKGAQEPSEPKATVSTIKEKEKKDKVLISVSSETIREGLSSMGVLITQEYYFTQVETYTKDKTLFKVIPLSSGFMYSYDGAVMAGVDFGEIQIDTDEDRKIVHVKMPDSEIQAVTIDKNTFQVYSEKESLWNRIKLEDYNISLVEFEDAAKQKALESGILEKSDEQARNLVRGFISSLPTAAGYTISFQ